MRFKSTTAKVILKNVFTTNQIQPIHGVDVSLHISANFMLSLFFPLKSKLPYCDMFPHSYLLLHFWLDKGMVMRRVKKYPMLL